MKDIDKKILTNALHDACEALHLLENEAEECDEGVLMDQAREMLDALEERLERGRLKLGAANALLSLAQLLR